MNETRKTQLHNMSTRFFNLSMPITIEPGGERKLFTMGAKEPEGYQDNIIQYDDNHKNRLLTRKYRIDGRERACDS